MIRDSRKRRGREKKGIPEQGPLITEHVFFLRQTLDVNANPSQHPAVPLIYVA
jgi:hypothetical protein